MKTAIAFELSGNTAFFKKPDVNANVYFTYGHIPKVAMLGIFGAILGFGGYHEQNRNIAENGETELNTYPEFYSKLKHLRIAVVPQGGDRGYFSRKIQVFNNSVGYASKEDGNNLIVKEQWLENVHWTIYVLNDDSKEFRDLINSLEQNQAVYLPYLGKNDHPATLRNFRIVELTGTQNELKIDSLFRLKDVELGSFGREKNPYFYKEKLPYALEEKLNSYLFEEFVFTNRRVKQICTEETFFLAEKRFIAFY